MTNSRDKTVSRAVSARALYVRFYPYAKKDIKRIVASLCALGGIIVAEMGIPILIRNVIDTFSRTEGIDILIPILNRFSVWYFGIILAVFMFTFAQSYLMATVGQRFMARLRTALFRHISAQSYSFFNTQPVGTLISRITNDVEGVQELFNNVLTGLLRNIATLVGVFITMALINIQLTLFALVALPIVIPISLVFNRMLRRASLLVREATAKLIAFISEHISGIATVQIFSKEKRDREHFGARNSEVQRRMFKEIYTNAIFRPLLDLCAAVLIAYIFIISGILQIKGAISVGIVAAFLSLITRFFQQLTGIADNFLAIQSGLSGLERVAEALDYAHIPTLHGIDPRHTIAEGIVEFKGVGFSYDKKQETLNDITFRIRPGETVALVGYTGSGKSTIANLLSRLWEVDSGSIIIDGHNINTISPNHLYENIAVSGKQIALFNDSIRENITLGREMKDEQVRAAATLVYADAFIQKLSDGYNTRIVDGGANQLSFGQQQLLIFARIIAHDPRVIILDEATSGIDSETEQKIQRAIKSLLAKRSALVIAHRLSTIQNADRILALANGKIIESGTHATLMAHQGYYATLWKYQFNETRQNPTQL